jgi:NTP pyrophosphatase (non-canonical NTP hydrolase)
MTLVQEEKLKKYLAFREYLLQNPRVIELYPQLRPYYEAFLNYLILILKTNEMMDESANLICNYNRLKNDLIKVALSVSRKVTAYSLLEELTDVLGLFCFTYDELSTAADEKIRKKCLKLLQFILSYKTELMDYGIDMDLENNFRDLLDQFSTIVETKNMQSQTSSMVENHIESLLNETGEIFEKKLQPVTENTELKHS